MSFLSVSQLETHRAHVSEVLKKVLCIVDGFFMWACLSLQCVSYFITRLHSHSWEFMTTLGYEWNIIQKRLRYGWTIWVRNYFSCVLRYSSAKKSDVLTGKIYSLTRAATLLTVAINIFNLDATTAIDCQVRPILFLASFDPPLIRSVPKVAMVSQFV